MRLVAYYETVNALIARLPRSRKTKLILVGIFVFGASLLCALGALFFGDWWIAAIAGAIAGLLIVGLMRIELMLRQIRNLPTQRVKSTKDLTKSINKLRSDIGTLRLESTDLRKHVNSLTTYGITRRDLDTHYAQTQAIVALYSMVDNLPDLPATRGWAASPDLLAHLVTLLRTRKPRLIVECGSGVSTIVLSAAARQHSPETRIIALEHDETFGAMTQANLERLGYADIAEVRIAPLEHVSDEESALWYAKSITESLDGIDMLFVDGPPEATGPLARKPALDVLWSALGPDPVIILDDTIRTSEQAVVAAWVSEHPELVETQLPFEAGASVLRKANS